MSFTEYKASESSQKILLAKVECGTRESDFVLLSGDVYWKKFSKSPVITSVESDGVALVEASSSALSAGEYCYDIKASILYVRTPTSDNPNSHFLVTNFFLFFSSRAVSLSHNLGSGFDVAWCPILDPSSQFTVALDNKDINIGNAVEGSGTLSFINDLDFWVPKFDNYVFENRRAFVYQYNLSLAPSEARLVYKGSIQTKSYTPTTVKLGLKDLFNAFRNEVPLDNVSDFEYAHDILGSVSARVTSSEELYKQRIVYGRPNGVSLLNVDKGAGFIADGLWDATSGSDRVFQASAGQPLETLQQGDEISFASNPGRIYKIDRFDYTFSPARSFYLTENFAGSTVLSDTVTIETPGRFIQRYQRYWLLSGHPLSSRTSVVLGSLTGNLFRVADITGMKVGDTITVDGAETRTIIKISPGQNMVGVDIDFTFLPVVGMSVERSPIRALYFDGKQIEENLHYTVDADKGLIKLDRTIDNHPEFFLSTVIRGIGTVDKLTDNLIGPNNDSVDLSKQLQVGDWVEVDGDTRYRQIQSIESDGTVTLYPGFVLGSPPSNNGFNIRKPDYKENPIISADVIGKTDSGTTDGDTLETGPLIVRDLLQISGVGDDLLSSSFDTSSVLVDHVLGIVVPDSVSSTSTKALREVVNKVNSSIFGSLFQNEDYLIEYSVLDPSRDATIQKLTRHDILSFSVKTDNRTTVKRVDLNYNTQEVGSDLAAGFDVYSFDSDVGTFLVKTGRVKTVQTVLVDESSARIFAGRWARFLELGRSLVTITTKLQTTNRSINDKIDFDHPSLFQRFGSDFTRKIGLVSEIRRSVGTTQITFDDLGNSFTKKSTLTTDDADKFTDADENQKMVNGYITDADGNVGTDTTLTNLIW